MALPDEEKIPENEQAEHEELPAETPEPEQEEEAQEDSTDSELEPTEALQKALKEVEKFKDAALRAEAEMQNMQRRTARDVENAHKFLDFLMSPQITADITNYVWYASANTPALELIDQEILDDPGIFPSEAVKENLWVAPVYNAREDRAINRARTRIKTGQ